MEKEFIPYEQALALKELGFDEECLGAFTKEKYFETVDVSQFHEDFTNENSNYFECKNSWYSKNGECISAPLYQQAFRWFREKYNFYNQIHKGYGWEGIIRNSSNGDILWNDGTYTSPEEAELECLKKLMEIVKAKINLQSSK